VRVQVSWTHDGTDGTNSIDEGELLPLAAGVGRISEHPSRTLSWMRPTPAA